MLHSVLVLQAGHKQRQLVMVSREQHGGKSKDLALRGRIWDGLGRWVTPVRAAKLRAAVNPAWWANAVSARLAVILSVVLAISARAVYLLGKPSRTLRRDLVNKVCMVRKRQQRLRRQDSKDSQGKRQRQDAVRPLA